MDEVSAIKFRQAARQFRHFALLFFVACAISCSDGRPEESQARADFVAHFPDYEVLSVKISEDEVVARSFEIACRKQGSDLQQKTVIQYIKYDNGWKLSPGLKQLR